MKLGEAIVYEIATGKVLGGGPFASAHEAEEYVGTLPGAEQGLYGIDVENGESEEEDNND